MNVLSAQAQSGRDSYTDLSSVNAIGALKDKNLALEKIAQQFESMMMRMMTKSMRAANEVFAEGNFLSSKEGDMYQDMLDDQLALSLSEGRGMGLAEVMVRQLKGRYGESEKLANNQVSDISNYLKHRNTRNDEIAIARPAAVSAAQPVVQTDQSFDGSIQSFVNTLYPIAQKAARALGIDPEAIIAQSALETGWGVKVSGKSNGASSNNFFNIKADQRWDGDSVKVDTMEVINGLPVRQRADFRAYESAEQSFDDYVGFINGSARYQDALASEDSETYVRGLKEAGYATDPDYADKILSIMQSDSLRQAIDAVKQSLSITTPSISKQAVWR